MFTVIFVALISLIIVMRITMDLYESRGYWRWLYHDIFKWHIPTEATRIRYENGDARYATCKYCGRALVKDDQDNWY